MKYFIIILILILILIGIALAAAWREYRRNFYVRMSEPTGFIPHYLSEHPKLRHESFSCLSGRGTKICGLQLIPEGEPEALIVMTHGYNLSCEN